MHRDIGFWLAVVLVSIVGEALFKIIAGKFGGSVPVLADLAAFL